MFLNMLEENFQRPLFLMLCLWFCLSVSRVTQEPQSSELPGLTMEIHFGLHHPLRLVFFPLFFSSETLRALRQKKSGSERWNHNP